LVSPPKSSAETGISVRSTARRPGQCIAALRFPTPAGDGHASHVVSPLRAATGWRSSSGRCKTDSERQFRTLEWLLLRIADLSARQRTRASTVAASVGRRLAKRAKPASRPNAESVERRIASRLRQDRLGFHSSARNVAKNKGLCSSRLRR